MIITVLLLALLPQTAGLSPAPAAGSATPPAVRTEKLTPAEMKSLTDARKALADAQDNLNQAKAAQQGNPAEGKKALDAAQDRFIHAKAALQGTTEGIEQDHHANTDCGCYVDSSGRDYDKVEFKDDTIIIHHIHEDPPSLSKKTNP